MGITLSDLERKGLAACAIVFVAAAYGAALCGLIVVNLLMQDAGFSRQNALWVTAAFWLSCMAFTWFSIARKRDAWETTPVSLSIFHWFQFVAIGAVLLTGYLFGKEYAAPQWFGFIIEVTVALFYFSYIFLGLTLRAPVLVSAYGWLTFATGAAWWTFIHLH